MARIKVLQGLEFADGSLQDVGAPKIKIYGAATDQTLSAANTTLQNDASLAFPIGTASIFFIECFIPVGATSTVPDFKYGFTYPSSCTIRHGQFVAGAGTYGFYSTGGTPGAGANDETSTPGFDLAAIAYNPIHFLAWVYSGGTAGTVQLQWAKRTSDATTITAKAGRFIRRTAIVD